MVNNIWILLNSKHYRLDLPLQKISRLAIRQKISRLAIRNPLNWAKKLDWYGKAKLFMKLLKNSPISSNELKENKYNKCSKY